MLHVAKWNRLPVTFQASHHTLIIFYTLFLFKVYLRAVGGEIGATSSLAPKIGPLGLVSWNIRSNSMFVLTCLCFLSTVSQEGW